tara:strand:+ start:3306 stop:3800 length:495 start_codon:yes stop_codon:yes gene_type:complete
MDYDGYKWIKVPRYKMREEATWEERYQDLEAHHIEEMEFLINEVRRLAHASDPELPFKNSGRNTPDAGTVEADTLPCGVCKTPMPVTRDRHGPTGSVEAMAKRGHDYDRYECPHIKELWHQQAIVLAKEIRNSRSLTLRTTLLAELKQILFKREPTIDEVIYFI